MGWLDVRFPGIEGYWDAALFRQHILRVLKVTDRLLDVGGGAGILPQMNFRGHAVEIHGIDLDPRITSNPHIDFGYIANAEKTSLADSMFNVAVADNVMEHLGDPDAVFAEINRVLKPGSVFLFKAPNGWNYMPLIARMTSTGFHKFYNKIRGRNAEDTFPTRYRKP